MTHGSIDLATGMTMPYIEQGDPTCPTLLLVHAIGDSQRIFKGMLEHLPPSIHVLVPTMRGHGDASRPASGYRPIDFAADIAAFMDGLHISSAVIAGGSSGGLVARRFAIEHPERTDGLVLLGTPFSLRDNPLAQRAWETIFSKLSDPLDPELVRAFLEDTLPRPLTDPTMQTLLQESLKVPGYVWRQTFNGILTDDSSDRLGSIQIPTILIWGAADNLVPLDDQESMVRLINDARLLIYPDAGHMFYLESPVRVAADLTSFVLESGDRAQ